MWWYADWSRKTTFFCKKSDARAIPEENQGKIIFPWFCENLNKPRHSKFWLTSSFFFFKAALQGNIDLDTNYPKLLTCYDLEW